MAVQVQVKGPSNGVDFPLFGHDARIERINQQKEVVVVTDVDNITLYLIPLDKVRFITPLVDSSQQIPRSLGKDTTLKVHIKGDSEGDFEQVCDRIEYTKRYDTMMAELFSVIPKGENEPPEVNLLLAMPFDNIRYVDFNYFIGEREEPKTQKSGQGSKPKATNKSGNKTKIKPNIKTKARN